MGLRPEPKIFVEPVRTERIADDHRPRFHEGRGAQDRPRDAALAQIVFGVKLGGEEVDRAVSVRYTRRCEDELPDACGARGVDQIAIAELVDRVD